MDKILFVADLGHFKVYKLSKTPQGTGKLDLIDSFDSLEAHGKFSEKVTDSAGKFGESVGKNSSVQGSGEAHNIELENEKRLIKNIAKSISKIVIERNCDSWHLAAEKAINGQIIEFLDPTVKAKLEKNIAANLTKADKTEIISRFI
ncbi:MAG TPA: host attachment protein [Dissulfurispiraceae bacterium]|nr:host attachment protein [Dissulfurispiraceae bacterium]